MERTTREIWRSRVRQWQKSGLTAERFAAGRGFSASSLRNWKWRLGSRGQRPPEARRRRVPPTFVEVVDAAGLLRAGGGCSGEPFEVILGSPLCIRVPVHFDQVELVRLLDVLENR